MGTLFEQFRQHATRDRMQNVPRLTHRPAQLGFAVVDVETTGLFPAGHDRIIEIGVVTLDQQRTRVDEWTTLVNPRRDVGPTRIHGITASQVAAAPTFSEIAGDLAQYLGGRVIVGHNVRFDLGFLATEFGALGADIRRVEGLDTMALAAWFTPAARSLSACCAALGVEGGGAHHALADAETTAGLFVRCMDLADRAGSPVALPDAVPRQLLPAIAPSGRRVTRELVPLPPPVTLAGLAAQLPMTAVRSDGDAEHLDSYVELLDRALEDRRLTPEEVEGLAATAAWLGITAPQLEQIHRAYMGGLAQLALADGILTPGERRELATIATLLGVPGAAADPTQLARVPGVVIDRRREWHGKQVCFTGTSVCCVDSVPLTRAAQEQLAAAAGLVVAPRVTKQLDILVLADPESTSGKARQADRCGVRKVAERAFWAALGVTVD